VGKSVAPLTVSVTVSDCCFDFVLRCCCCSCFCCCCCCAHCACACASHHLASRPHSRLHSSAVRCFAWRQDGRASSRAFATGWLCWSMRARRAGQVRASSGPLPRPLTALLLSAPLRRLPAREQSPGRALERWAQAPGPARGRRVDAQQRRSRLGAVRASGCLCLRRACPPVSPSSTTVSARGVAGQGPRALGAGSWACSWTPRGCAAAALKTGGFFRLATASASPLPAQPRCPFRSAIASHLQSKRLHKFGGVVGDDMSRCFCLGLMNCCNKQTTRQAGSRPGRAEA